MQDSGSSARALADTILLVDDYADARATIRELLEEHGHPVVEAANGQQALDILVSRSTPSIGLIVLDLEMPVMDGVQFLKLLHNYVGLSRIPVLVVSAHTRRLDESARKKLAGCLSAPYDLKELLRMVRGFVAPPAPLPRA